MLWPVACSYRGHKNYNTDTHWETQGSCCAFLIHFSLKSDLISHDEGRPGNVLDSVCEGESGWYIVLIWFLVDNKTLETALVSH